MGVWSLFNVRWAGDQPPQLFNGWRGGCLVTPGVEVAGRQLPLSIIAGTCGDNFALVQACCPLTRLIFFGVRAHVLCCLAEAWGASAHTLPMRAHHSLCTVAGCQDGGLGVGTCL